MNATFEDLVEVIRHNARYEHETAIPGLLVVRADGPTAITKSLYRPCFGLIASGSKEVMFAETSFVYGERDSLVCVADVPVAYQVIEAHPNRPYLAFHMEIEPLNVAALLQEQVVCDCAPSRAEIATKHVIDDDLYDPLVRLVSLLERPSDIPVLAPLIRKEIVWRLLGSKHGQVLRQLARSNAHAVRIGRTTSWIRDNITTTLNIAELAAEARMSVASFHRHFKAVTSLSPVQFQKRVRLQEARRILPNASSISETAYDVGYESISQFNRDYRRLFNLTPSGDAAMLRAKAD